MTTSKYILCAVPATLWTQDIDWGGESIGLASFVKDAMGIERRIPKGVNLDNERTRYHLICSRMETIIPSNLLVQFKSADYFLQAVNNFQFPFVEIDGSHLDILKFISIHEPESSKKYRFLKTFFLPEEVRNHVVAFENIAKSLNLIEEESVVARINFLKQAQKANCGILIFFEPFCFFEGDNPIKRENFSPAIIPQKDIIQGLYNSEEDYIDKQNLNLYQILRGEIEKAVKISKHGGLGEVNFSNQPHNVITEVIREFVYIDNEKFITPTYIKVIYNDGSQGPLFPLRCIPKRENSFTSHNTILRIALMSMRHLEMDHTVDMAWLRNREVSKSRALGETDVFCYKQSKEQFTELFDGENLTIYLYHTGFQPAILGFYRAFVETIVDRKLLDPKIEIVPQYHHRQKGYISGDLWN